MKKNTVLASAVALTGLFSSTVIANADTITVKEGDTLSKIAKENKTTVETLVKANKISNADLIFVGQELETELKDADKNTDQQVSDQSNTGSVQSSTNTNVVGSTYQAPAATSSNSSYSSYSSNVGGNDAAAKAWIAQRESGGSYTAQNGQYIGKYQLTASYLGGDYSPANQERVADQYVANRYGSWSNAKSHWLANGWY
ncbi:peptidoglycan binding protein [Ligilactobacillus hayakitensis DSM 18933 = JCM 14209]|uniref:Peptidoglycan binding protein n=1 Tax=Ligilactobacillus hayakitensis DSM 18933 = JCM 14209 TaxID=1423755 RepID=A0A0R1WQ92_9LACO|nr:LysM peptidoglycan-binding domain-containing protein [Ligilactobacillus hayakitensis]KRM17913.1 peptidoglycan binding protein [Ligilactobacillus hayakitensis DSM 18933 = JCM 14209]